MDPLSFPEARVLGSLIEKELTTPDYYPLTLNSLIAACNQTTSRDPVTAFDEAAVQEAADALRQKQLATAVFGSGSRVQKYRHNFLDHYQLDRKELALLGVLLLRGAQTPGELRQRAERMAGGFESLTQVETALEGMAAGDFPLLKVIPAGLGRKEKRYVHLLCGEPAEPVSGGETVIPAAPAAPGLREEVAALRGELEALREEFAAFRKQFE